MSRSEQQTLNPSKPEELAYWSRILNVAPTHLVQAIKATGSNLVNRMVWFLKAEGLLPHHFDLGKGAA